MRITVILDDTLIKRIDDERKKREIIPTRSDIIREALKHYLEVIKNER